MEFVWVAFICLFYLVPAVCKRQSKDMTFPWGETPKSRPNGKQFTREKHTENETKLVRQQKL